MKCFCCKTEMTSGTKTHVVDLKSCVVIVRNVPCVECERCGEAYYTDDVAERLDEIVQAMKNLMTEVAVVEYSDGRAA